MATTPAAHLIDTEREGRKIGVTRLAASGGLAAAITFVLCWVGIFIPFASPTHAYIQLFTTAQASSVDALLEGSLWSLLFGMLTGAVFGAIYNFLAGLEGR